MCGAVFLMGIGFMAAQVKTHRVYTPMLLKKISPVGVRGTILSIEPLGGTRGSRVILNDLEIERLSPSETPHKIRLTIRKDEGVKAGQRVKVLAGLNPASPPSSPGAFDFQRMSYFKGIGAVGFAYGAPEILEQVTDHGSPLENLRRKIADRIISYTDKPQQAVLVALMTGQRQSIREEDWVALRGAGLAHLLAISGLHVGMVAGVLFFFVRLLLAFSPYLALHYPIKKWAAIIALLGACFYTLVVGATIPTQRALMMTGLVMVAIIFDRSAISMRLVALAAFVVLFFSPESLMSVSFQMSFAAVVALICFYQYIRPVWLGFYRSSGFMRRVILYFVGVSLTTLVAGAATGLFALYHFQNYAVYGMLANLIAVPLMAFVVMPLLVLSYVLMPLGLAASILSIAEWGVGWILATAHWVAGLDGALWLVPSWPQWIFILMVLSILIAMIWQGRLRIMIIPILIFLTSLVFLYKQPSIQISSKFDLVSVRDEDGSLWFSTGKKERFTAKIWLRRNGQKSGKGKGLKKKIWPKEGGAEPFPLTCDPYGCRGVIEGQKVAVAFSNKAWREDCHWADILISKVPVPYNVCPNRGGEKNRGAQNVPRYVIDYFDLWRAGAHAIWLVPNGRVKIKTVEQYRGNRLWTQTSANKKRNEK